MLEGPKWAGLLSESGIEKVFRGFLCGRSQFQMGFCSVQLFGVLGGAVLSEVLTLSGRARRDTILC